MRKKGQVYTMSKTNLTKKEEKAKAALKAAKERVKLITLCSKEMSNNIREEKTGKSISIWNLFLLNQNGGINRTKAQRGFLKNVLMMFWLLNDIIHGVLHMEGIALFLLVPKGCPDVSSEDYFADPKKYQADGYKLYILDGSQRIRTIIGFLDGSVTLSELFFETTKTVYSVEKVSYKELPTDAQERFKNTEISYSFSCGSSMKEFRSAFEKRNRLQSKLNNVELLNNMYGHTALFVRCLDELGTKKVIDLLGLSNKKSHNMQDIENEYMQESDRGSALHSLMKILVHINGDHANADVNTMVENWLKENENAKKKDIDSIFSKFRHVLDICNKFDHKFDNEIFGGEKKSMNRIRSVLAAVSIMEDNKPGLLEDNMNEINEAIEALHDYMPSAQDASGTKDNINNEIDMYIGFFRYICDENNDSEYGGNNIEASLSYTMRNNRKCELYDALENYYCNKNKMPA